MKTLNVLKSMVYIVNPIQPRFKKKTVVSQYMTLICWEVLCLNCIAYLFFLISSLSPKKCNCGCFTYSLVFSPHGGIGPLVGKGVKEHNIHCELKSYKLKILKIKIKKSIVK